jgi:hypothetical protein
VEKRVSLHAGKSLERGSPYPGSMELVSSRRKTIGTISSYGCNRQNIKAQQEGIVGGKEEKAYSENDANADRDEDAEKDAEQ